MSVPDNHAVPVDLAEPAPAVPSSEIVGRKIPRTRTAKVWFGVCAAAVTSVVLIVFVLQNTGPTEVTFLWLHGTLPLALALLIAAAGAALLTMVAGVARVTQLRRLAARRP